MRQNRARSAQEFDAAFPLAATIRPLQIAPSLLTRSFDLGVGYHLLPTTSQTFYHGPHAELAWLNAVERPDFMDWFLRDDDRARLGLRVRGQAFWGDFDGPVGRGGAVQVFFEGFSFHDGDFGGCSFSDTQNSPAQSAFGEEEDEENAFCGAGYAWGESSIGLFIETSYARIDTRDQWLLSIGLTVGAPATIGAGFIAGNL